MTIEERMENMERELGRQKRRNRWLLGAMLLVVGGLVAAGVFRTMVTPAQAQVAGKEIRANRILLEDENGKVRVDLSVVKDISNLSLMDENGKERVALHVTKGTPALWLMDENGKTRITLSVDKVGPGLFLYHENDKASVGMAAFKGGPSLMLSDESHIRALLAMGKDGPNLSLCDENGKVRFIAGKTMTQLPDGKTTGYPESSLILFGPDGNVIWSAIK